MKHEKLGVFTMKHILLTSLVMGSFTLSGLACTKKSMNPANEAPLPPPSAVPETSNPTPMDPTPTPNEMPGQPDSTNSIPGDSAPMEEGVLPSDTTPAPGTNMNAPVPNNTVPPAP
jgi:hypothetical protein